MLAFADTKTGELPAQENTPLQERLLVGMQTLLLKTFLPTMLYVHACETFRLTYTKILKMHTIPTSQCNTSSFSRLIFLSWW